MTPEYTNESPHLLRDHAQIVEARCPDRPEIAGDMRAAAEEIRQLRMAIGEIENIASDPAFKSDAMGWIVAYCQGRTP